MALQSNTELRLDLERYQLFEDLLLEISTHFINLPVEGIDNAIEDAQRRICKCLDLDLSALWQWSDRDRDIMTVTHLHSPPGGPELPVGIDGSTAFPWLYKKLLEGESLAFTNDELPVEAGIDKASRRSFGVESSVAIPLRTGGRQVLAILSFDTLHRQRSWNEREVKRFKLVAEIFSNALSRKQSDRKCRESEARLALAAESGEAGIWELNCATGQFWSTDQARRIFDYPSGETISMERFEQSVYHEDLEEVRKALTDSFLTGNRLNVEYRISSSEERFKWICSVGRPYFHHDGSPSRMLGLSVDVSERKQMEMELRENLVEIDRLKKQLEDENYYLREDLRKGLSFKNLIGQSSEFQTVLTAAKQVASTSATVLLLGETGTGKGVIADIIHQLSERSNKAFVTVNCAALPNNLIESELFGREKGAFTGAHARQVGRFEVANNGTIFLDEIGEMSLEMQAKLLRVLQEGEFERLGSPQCVKVDVRVIAATGRNLRDDVKNGRFREDLFYRINVFPITIPPLRERKEDIPHLAQYFVEKYGRKMGKKIDRIPKASFEKMVKYGWPGNVRELEHLVERSVIMSSSTSLILNEQYVTVPPAGSATDSVRDLESVVREHIYEVLEQTDWKIEGPGGASEILNIHPSTLRFKLKKMGIQRPA